MHETAQGRAERAAGGAPRVGTPPPAALAFLALALSGAALWTRVPRGDYLGGVVVATVASLVLAWRRPRPRHIGGAPAALLAWAAVAGAMTAQLRRLDRAPAATAEAVARADARRLVEAIALARSAAETAVRDATRGGAAALVPPRVPGAEVAILRRRGGVVTASAGPWRVVPPSSVPPGGALVETPLYRVLVVGAPAPDGEVVAGVLLQASLPVARFARHLVAAVVGEGRAPRVEVARAPSPRGLTLPAVAGIQVAVDVLAPDAARLAVVELARLRTLPLLLLALALGAIDAWRRPRRRGRRMAALGVALAVLAVLPLNALSNRSQLVDASVYFAPLGGPWTANLLALALTAALSLVGVFTVSRSAWRPSRTVGALGVLVVAAAGPFLLRDLARGIAPPQEAIPTALWAGWQVALMLSATAVLQAGVLAGRALRGAWPGVAPWVAPFAAAVAAAGAPLVWRAPAGWPDWYTVPWILVVTMLAVARGPRRGVLTSTIVSGCAAATLVWGVTARRSVELAERDVAALGQVDEDAARLLERTGWQLLQRPLPRDAAGLLAVLGGSELAAAGFRVSVHAWGARGDTMPLAAVHTSALEPAHARLAAVADLARDDGRPLLVAVEAAPAALVTLAVADSNGTALTLAVAPRSVLARERVLTPLVGAGGGDDAPPPYALALTPIAAAADGAFGAPTWERDGARLVGDWATLAPGGARQVHAEVDLGTWDALLPRGLLLVGLDIGVVLLLWALAVLPDGGLPRWARWRWRRTVRSYRARLALVLAAFFVVPAVGFASWTATRLRADDRAARGAVARERLADVLPATPLGTDGAPRFVYAQRQLVHATDPVLLAAAPFGRVLDDATVRALTRSRQPDPVVTRVEEGADGPPSVVAYRALAPGAAQVAMAPAVRDDAPLARRRADLLAIALAATLAGGVLAVWLGGRVARQLERPVGALRGAVLTLPASPRVPAALPAEFVPAFDAVERAALALTESRVALEAARQRTEAVLRHVASAVVAIDAEGRVHLANPRAEALGLTAGGGRERTWPPAIAERLERALAADGSEEDDARLAEPLGFEWMERQWQGRLARLPSGGAVLTLDDVTELAQAERVLAWGEMARQVAHEIKNPLTPVRLGIQHVRRAWRDGRPDFAELLETNVARILIEIDHLDQIARQFSRLGAPAPAALDAPLTALEPVDVAQVIRAIVDLERMGSPGVSWVIEDAPAAPRALARPGEVHEVLLNLCENARLAEATAVRLALEAVDGGLRLTVQDDGVGIPKALLPRLFEPRFSTRTSGTGLGLAICRRLVSGWGGAIGIDSVEGQGTTVTVVLPVTSGRAEPAGPTVV